ncbi:MAG TPA: oligosaccharide flippase family protein [Myxococcales bacterium]|nr:oligosaccharide flippase family protein [Myxococcales bacterium]
MRAASGSTALGARAPAQSNPLFHDSILSIAAAATDAGGAFVVNLLIGRLLGERPTGEYGYAQTLASTLLAVFGVGLPSYLVQEMAARRGRAAEWRQHAATIIRAYALISLPLALASFLALNAALRGRMGAYGTVAPAMVGVFAALLSGMFIGCFQGLGDFRPGFVATVLTRLGSSLAVVAVYLAGRGIGTYLSAAALVQVAVAGAMGWVLSRRISARPLPGRATLDHLRASLPFGIIVLLEITYFRADTLLVEWLVGGSATGWYVAAYAFYMVPLVLTWAAASAFYPWVAERTARGASQERERFRMTLALLAGGICAAIGLRIAGPPALLALYGAQFAPSGPILSTLALAVPLVALNRLCVVNLKGTGRVRSAAISSAAAATVAVLANLVCLPRFGVLAAAWVTVATEGVLLLGVSVAGGWRAPAPSVERPA